jgi:hypothetical protein
MSVDRATYRRIKTQILKAITKGVQVNGQHVFNDSQRKVPVQTGFLKKSGGLAIKKDGWKIVYKAPYAAQVEEGSRGGRVYVEPAVRQAYVRKDGTKVKATPIKGYYTTAPERKGTRYLTRAVESSMMGLPQTIFNALQKTFTVKGSSSTSGKPTSSGGNSKSSSGGSPQGSKHKNKYGGKR